VLKEALPLHLLRTTFPLIDGLEMSSIVFRVLKFSGGIEGLRPNPGRVE